MNHNKNNGDHPTEEVPEREPVSSAEQAADKAAEKSKAPDIGSSPIRKFLTFILIVFIVSSLFISIAHSQAQYETVFYQDVSRYLTENLRIIYISDLHSKTYGDNNTELLNEIRRLSPDLILLGGDIVDRKDVDDTPVLAVCENLVTIAPVYAVLGNHESERIYFDGDADLVARYEKTGVQFLRNESRIIQLGNNTVQLIGVEGTEDGFVNDGVKDKLDQIEYRTDLYKIMLDHYPLLFVRRLAGYSFDLGLAGHTHGGIVRLPGIGGLYTAEEGLFPKYDKGEFTLRNGADMIIGGGLGGFGWVPRVVNPPQLLVIDVNWC